MLNTIRFTSARLTRTAVPRFAPVAWRAAAPLRFYSNKINEDSVAFKYNDVAPIVRYTEDHEWIILHADQTAFLGITKYASDALGDVTYVEVPEAGAEVVKGESIGSVESVKSASDIYSPVDGEVIEGNEGAGFFPQLIGEDPMGAAWLAKIRVKDIGDVEGLLTLEAYEDHIKS